MNTKIKLITCLVMLAAVGCEIGCAAGETKHSVPSTQGTPTQTKAALDHAELVKQGELFVRLGGCGDCHTPMAVDPKLGMPVPQMERMLSGHPEGAPTPKGAPGSGDQAVIGSTFTSFKLPFGVVYSANLTPDKETGLGSWSEAEFIATMRTGHERGKGRAVLPPMPWQNLSKQPDDSLRAIFAYLQSVPAVKNRVPAPDVPQPVIASISQSYEAAKRAQPN